VENRRRCVAGSPSLAGVNEPIVYWRPGCPFCLKLRTKLTLTRTPHQLVNVWQDPAASQIVRDVNGGNELVPTVRVGDRFLSNPTLRQVRQAVRAS
jgi:glutaredoxin